MTSKCFLKCSGLPSQLPCKNRECMKLYKNVYLSWGKTKYNTKVSLIKQFWKNKYTSMCWNFLFFFTGGTLKWRKIFLSYRDPETLQISGWRSCLYLLDGIVDGSKCWLLVIMVNSPVTMENEDTFMFSLLTVAAINTVVWTVVPLAWEHIKAFCETKEGEKGYNTTRKPPLMKSHP